MSSVVGAAARRNAAVDVEADVKARHHNRWIWWQRIEVTMQYHHTQKAPMYLILVGSGALMVLVSFLMIEDDARISLFAGGAGFIFLGLCFRELTIFDDVEGIVIQFGPVPVFRRRLRYRDFDRVERSRSTWLDGWGIHWNGPSKGWTWNLWGYDCVDAYAGARRKIRIGTDDPEGLETFLRERIDEVNRSAE